MTNGQPFAGIDPGCTEKLETRYQGFDLRPKLQAFGTVGTRERIKTALDGEVGSERNDDFGPLEEFPQAGLRPGFQHFVEEAGSYNEFQFHLLKDSASCDRQEMYGADWRLNS
ncbi:hypothetical protein [Rhizobium ruizarguesonis]|uniref:hypothetical protein n=1 Tax=Rhizobium ruizarguesonis TaxID=2081791 RepID=UPI001030F7C7|nr:hypothetical protein [Rhizobium ruizarguesonis]TAY73945.1 hypothetical protein ELH84_08645 [Rhizobium ruizarguesonis]